MVPKYCLHLAYVGTQFEGFQSQKSGKGIQDHLEKALAVMLREKVRVRGASRTDSGVHAQHQVASFSSSQTFQAELWCRSLNALLPADIKVLDIEEAAADFDPINDPCGKAYRYRLWLGQCRNPFCSPFVWSIYKPLDVGRFTEELVSCVGTYDFTSFCASDKVQRLVPAP